MVRTKIWPSSVTLTLGQAEWMFQMAHLNMIENNSLKLFWNSSTIVELQKLLSGSIWMDAHTHWRMHIRKLLFNNYVLLTPSGPDNKNLCTTFLLNSKHDKPPVILFLRLFPLSILLLSNSLYASAACCSLDTNFSISSKQLFRSCYKIKQDVFVKHECPQNSHFFFLRNVTFIFDNLCRWPWSWYLQMHNDEIYLHTKYEPRN